MYSGTTFRNKSGRIMGAHQKLDRAARKALETLMPGSAFPAIKDILHFEGNNGPDGIKRKSPAKDEPWHYYDPTDPSDKSLIKVIRHHSQNLSAALKDNENERASFEAAWLAHALADGLTPAHHFPLEKKLEELRGEGLETRTSLKDKFVIKGQGDNRRQMLLKNWEYWGAKGIMTTHGLFEWGIATTIAPLRLKRGYPNLKDCEFVFKHGIVRLFQDLAKDIYDRHMYDRFIEKGWNRGMAHEVRTFLAPEIVRIITLAWYEAYKKANK